MRKEWFAAFLCVIVVMSCLPSVCLGTEAEGLDAGTFGEDMVKRSGAIELLQKICGQSWAIFLGTFGAKQSAVAGEGDGLSSKASRLKQSGDLLSALKADSELIGPTIAAASIASAVPDGNEAVSKPEPSQPCILKHVVEKGESLWTIANIYGVTTDTLAWANSLANPNKLKVGQVLTFPSVTGVVHEVSRGESIWSIAKKYGVSRDKIVQANALADPDSLQLKQSLIIPGGKPPAVTNRVVVASRGSADARILSAVSSSGGLAWPVSGRITSRFGPRWGRMHNGIDIGVPIGTSVRAAAAGVVSFTGWNGGYGRLVILDHGDGVCTYYGHNSAITVSRGQKVAAGERIARSGNSGISTGPHVHFEVRVGGKPQNPENYLP
ncbi:MAG: peptidoglycan DD-metalloendopeptidase family protein [Bacillota bacterium]